ncbi:hypothetical protein Tco_1469736, partial [Tanacetum coccineum]
SKKNDTSNVLQDINHIKSFNNDYPEMPNNDDRVVPNLNSDYKSQSDSSHSSMSSGGVDTADFPSNNFGNDADSSDDIFAAQDEQAWQLSNHPKNPSISSKPDRAYICTISGAIRPLRFADNEKELWDLRTHQTGKETGGEGMSNVLGLQRLKQGKVKIGDESSPTFGSSLGKK